MEYGLIGEKLGHSFSKEIHNQLCDYDYVIKEISKDDIPSFMANKDFKGINVTIPYKQTVIPFLDEISAKVRKIGAVNTIVNRDGKLYGYNTDYYGFNYMLSRTDIDVNGKTVALLGTGGAAKMARVALKDNGAKEVIVVSRNGDINYQTIKSRKDIQVIINATPMGMYPNNGDCLIDFNDFPNVEGVADMVYNPSVTEFIFRAREKGIKTVNGLSMLVAQAKLAAELFTGNEILDSQTEKTIFAVRKQTLNVTFVGMPASGKTTIGKELARLLDREFVDTDVIFESKYCHAGKYIEEHGEQAFRDKEQQVLADLLKESRKVISTGGGGILRKINRKNIKANSIVVWIKRDIENLSTDGRPLSKGADALKKLYAERAPLYAELSDITVENNGEIQIAVNEVIERLKGFQGEWKNEN